MKQRLQQLLAKAFSGSNAFKRMDMALAVMVTLVAIALYAYVQTNSRRNTGLRFITNIEARSLDARFNLRGNRSHDPNIVIVGLDENTLQRVGAFPIPRNAYGQMVDQLAKAGARAVVFDASFPTPEKNSAVDALKKLEGELHGEGGPPVNRRIQDLEASSDNDKIFAASIQRAGNVVLGHLFLDPERAKSVDAKGVETYNRILSDHALGRVQAINRADPTQAWELAGGMREGLTASGVYANIQMLAEAAKSFGFFNETPDTDGTYRREPLLIRYKYDDWDDFYPALDIEGVKQYEGINNDGVVVYMAQNGVDHISIGRHTIPSSQVERDGTVIINYAGPFHTYKHYSMIDVINGKFPPEAFRNKLVVFGATAVAVGDIRNTPYPDADYMGVELHANVMDNILHDSEPGRGFIRRGFLGEIIDLSFILSFGLVLGYAFSRTKPLSATITAIVALMAFAWVTFFCFAHYGLWLSFVLPAGTLVANYATITSFRMIFEEREKRKVRKTFERYVSPGVIALIEKDPKKYFKTGGESKELTVMFSDIRDFTRLSEGLTPNELVQLLNHYLGDMTDILFTRWGTLDKYIGDAIMGFWGSPFPQDDHAIRGCACALDMREKLKELNAQWAAEGRKQLAIGIGLNTGEVNVGNMGSSKRFAWTVMGDNVNLASRLEGITKEYHVQCVVSEATYRAAKDHYVFREIDRIRVKGKTLPVTIYELLDWTRNEAIYTERIARFSEALTAYRRQQWEEAIDLFRKMQAKFPDDGPAQTFVLRSHDLMEAPPEPDWDGVYAMKTK